MSDKTIQITVKLARPLALKLKKIAKGERRTIKAVLELLIENVRYD